MSNLRLLLAEEDEHTRTFLADNLTADGYHVDVVKDRDQAVLLLGTTAPDVIVVDVNGTTLALLDWLRGADSALCAAAIDTPVIVLTSRSEEVHWVRLLERGVMTWSSSRSPIPSFAPGSPRYCAARCRASHGRCWGPARCGSICALDASPSMSGRWSSPRSSIGCSATWPASPPVC